MPESAKKSASKSTAKEAASSQGESHPEDDLGYEEAREQLAEVVQALEQGGSTLAESIDLWERGERLARTAQRRLDGARERLDAALEREGATAEDD